MKPRKGPYTWSGPRQNTHFLFGLFCVGSYEQKEIPHRIANDDE